MVEVKVTGGQISEEEKNAYIQRIRRITGYLVGTLDRFNDAKRD